MSNLGTREKYGMIALLVVIILFFIYLFGIRNLNADYENQINQRNELQARIDYLDALKENNDQAKVELAQLRNNIIAEEDRFIPELQTEVLEQYVVSTFEDNGCPYLVNLSSADVSFPVVVLPDGSTAEDNLVCKRISVVYSTTDGYNIPQYNRENSIIQEDGIPDYEAMAELVEQMTTLTGNWSSTSEEGVWDADGGIGYDEFFAALKSIEEEDPDAILISDIKAVDDHGHMLLSASIDFYSVTFLNRISTNTSNAPYAEWAGATSINTDGGFIGMPYVVTNERSEWHNVVISELPITIPFTTYYSPSIFNQLAGRYGLPVVLGLAEGDTIPGITAPQNNNGDDGLVID